MLEFSKQLACTLRSTPVSKLLAKPARLLRASRAAPITPASAASAPPEEPAVPWTVAFASAALLTNHFVCSCARLLLTCRRSRCAEL